MAFPQSIPQCHFSFDIGGQRALEASTNSLLIGLLTFSHCCAFVYAMPHSPHPSAAGQQNKMLKDLWHTFHPPNNGFIFIFIYQFCYKFASFIIHSRCSKPFYMAKFLSFIFQFASKIREILNAKYAYQNPANCHCCPGTHTFWIWCVPFPYLKKNYSIFNAKIGLPRISNQKLLAFPNLMRF